MKIKRILGLTLGLVLSLAVLTGCSSEGEDTPKTESEINTE